MSYEKQTWNKYDELKTEEENIENGAVVIDNRMNHIEEGIESNDKANSSQSQSMNKHIADTANPHKVTALQVGLDKVDNVQQATKTDFDSHVNNKSNPHSVTASQVGAYSKTESDSKLTDLSNKAILNKGNIANGNDLNSVTDTGFYRIGGLVGGTDILNVSSELSGLNFYAFLKVTGALQELTVYAPRKDTTWTYSRSLSGNPAAWSSWSKTVMADDSGKVIIKDLVASSITLPNDTNGWITLQNLHYKKKNGLVSFWFDFTKTASGTAIVGTFPDGFIPPNDVMFVIVNWTTTTASSKVLQLTGLNSSINTGLVGILNAAANTRYTGHFTFSV